MNESRHIARRRTALTAVVCAVAFALLSCGCMAHAQAVSASADDVARVGAQLLDSVVAVVNNQVILNSDLDLEMHVYRLLPIGERGDETRAKALERLTTRALIEQQIVQEDPQGLDVSPRELTDTLAELRQSLPACKTHDCASTAGWAAYLATLGLTPARVSEYWTHRMAVLRFIELRFRSGNRVTPEEIEKYYREQLAPKYARPEDAPPLERISPRIQEILLQQKVNALMGDWLKSLQDQGQVEILDPTLRAQAANEQGGASTETGDKP